MKSVVRLTYHLKRIPLSTTSSSSSSSLPWKHLTVYVTHPTKMDAVTLQRLIQPIAMQLFVSQQPKTKEQQWIFKSLNFCSRDTAPSIFSAHLTVQAPGKVSIGYDAKKQQKTPTSQESEHLPPYQVPYPPHRQVCIMQHCTFCKDYIPLSSSTHLMRTTSKHAVMWITCTREVCVQKWKKVTQCLQEIEEWIETRHKNQGSLIVYRTSGVKEMHWVYDGLVCLPFDSYICVKMVCGSGGDKTQKIIPLSTFCQWQFF